MAIEKTLLSNNHSILYALQPGKPDPKVHKPKGKDTRTRVFQKANESCACEFYAFNIIRDRIGPFAAGFENQRYIEQQCSNWRKEIVKAYNPLEKDPNRVYKSLEKANQKIIKTFGKDPEQILFSFWRETIRDAFLQDPVITSNCNEGEIDGFIEKIIPNIQIDVEHVKPYFKLELLLLCVTKEMAAQLGLESSPWVPKQGVAGLADELKKNGPLVVKGKFGRDYYQELPFTLAKKINGYALLGWKPGCTRVNPCTFMCHTVVIVGADAQLQHIYFIDPNDASVPNRQRAIYVISFKNFYENLYSLSGSPTKETLHSATIGYALFNPLLKNYLE